MKTTAMKRLLRWFGAIIALCVFLWAVPKPLAGYWHTAYSDCLCSSKYLIQFRDGTVYRWALAHNTANEPYGTYRRGLWWIYWDTGKEIVRLRPGFIFMDVRAADNDQKKYGFREWRSDYIDDVLGYKKKIWTTRLLAGRSLTLKSDTNQLSFDFHESGSVLCAENETEISNLKWSIAENRLILKDSAHHTKFEYFLMSGRNNEIAVHDASENILIFTMKNEPNK